MSEHMAHSIGEQTALDAIHQLIRYGGCPDDSLGKVLMAIADLNDDIHHFRSEKLIRAKVAKAKRLLDKVAREWSEA